VSKLIISTEQPLSRFVTVELVLIKSHAHSLNISKVSMHRGPA